MGRGMKVQKEYSVLWGGEEWRDQIGLALFVCVNRTGVVVKRRGGGVGTNSIQHGRDKWNELMKRGNWYSKQIGKLWNRDESRKCGIEMQMEK